MEKISNDECLEEFLFMRNDIYELTKVFNIPDQFLCYNGTSATAIEGLCFYLHLLKKSIIENFIFCAVQLILSPIS